MSSLFSRLFPIPTSFTLPTVGLDFSDATMRFIQLKESARGLLPGNYAEEAIPDGCMLGGRIIDQDRFAQFLTHIRKKYNLRYVRVAIPESQVYSFTLAVDIVAVDDIRGAIELVLEDNIPLKVSETVFDYQVLLNTDKAVIVQVVAIADSVAQSYLSAFATAGIIPVSFEFDGQAIARAVLPPQNIGSSMIVDFGSNRTGITVVTNGTAVYTATLEFGGTALVSTLVKELGVSVAEAHRLLHEHGLSATGAHKELFTTIIGGISILKDEINRRFIYWHEKKDQFAPMPPIDTIYFCGGYSTIAGLADYLSATLKLKVVTVNPWRNCVSFDTAIPTLPHDEAMSYVTAIGLALADYLYD